MITYGCVNLAIIETIVLFNISQDLDIFLFFTYIIFFRNLKYAKYFVLTTSRST